MPGNEIGGPKGLCLQGFLHTVDRDAYCLKAIQQACAGCLTQPPKGEMDFIRAQLAGCFHEAVGNEGNLIFPAYLHHLFGQFTIPGIR